MEPDAPSVPPPPAVLHKEQRVEAMLEQATPEAGRKRSAARTPRWPNAPGRLPSARRAHRRRVLGCRAQPGIAGEPGRHTHGWPSHFCTRFSRDAGRDAANRAAAAWVEGVGAASMTACTAHPPVMRTQGRRRTPPCPSRAGPAARLHAPAAPRAVLGVGRPRSDESGRVATPSRSTSCTPARWKRPRCR